MSTLLRLCTLVRALAGHTTVFKIDATRHDKDNPHVIEKLFVNKNYVKNPSCIVKTSWADIT